MTACPRCGGDDMAMEHAAAEWEILRCRDCSFVWRTTEPPETLDPALRPARFQIGEG